MTIVHDCGNGKGGVCGPALQRCSMDAELLLEPLPAVADKPY